MKRARTLTVAFAAMFAAGCVNFTSAADLTLSSDDTLSGEMSAMVEYDVEALEEMEMDPAEADWLLTEEDVVDGQATFDEEGIGNVTMSYVGGDSPAEPHGFALTFDGTTFADFNQLMELMNEDGDWFIDLRLSRDGDDHVLEGWSDIPEGDEGSEDDMGMAMAVSEVTTDVTVTFVGDVADTNGQVDGNVVNWSQNGEIVATASAEQSSNVLLVVGGVLLLVAVVGGVVGATMMGRGRRSGADA